MLVLPQLAITKSNEHNRFPGTLSLSPETLLAMLRDIGASVARAGVERLVLFNGHGGNTALLHVAARELRISNGLIVATCSWSGLAETDGLFDAGASAVDLHAGDTETSAMLEARPGLVDMPKAKNFSTAMEGWAEDFRFIGLSGQPATPGWIAGDLNPDGVCGKAARKGRGDAWLSWPQFRPLRPQRRHSMISDLRPDERFASGVMPVIFSANIELFDGGDTNGQDALCGP